ncbi:AAA family ATPase [Nocardia sp. BMG111209]|uniref:AAA family ATPase n=1 Tax=Nocardia sp. BMG111209 TaxID=1160137 RepID=UPI0003658C05|nr:AAA family ATPase [Nocardia sp. BMG111209]
MLSVLRADRQPRLVLIHGPAGFGKTTLAMQWVRELEAGGTPVAWLTVERDDGNVVWFLTHLLDAIHRVRPDLGGELRTRLEEHCSDSAGPVLSALIDEIRTAARPLALVLDDWHEVCSDETRDAVAYLLEHGCAQLRIAIVGRGRPAVPATVPGGLVEIDATALRFDNDEVTDFLVGVSGLPLSPAEVATLQESTEGWPAGLQLARLSLTGCDDPAAFIDNLTGRHHVVGDYLAEHVLGSLEPALHEFLMAATIGTRICADLAEALTGRPDSAALLEQIADRNLFLQRLDERGEWFRFHPLFAGHLQRRLRYWDPDRVIPLHTCAATWFAERELFAEAVDHALAAELPERAVDVVEAHAVALIESSRIATFLGLMEKLPRPLTESRPRLQLCVAWANLSLARREQVHAAVRRALATVDAGGALPDREATAIRVQAALMVGMEHFLSDRFEGVPDLVIRHIDDLDAPALAVTAANLAAIDALNRFDFPAVRHWHGVAVRHSRGRGPYLMLLSHCILGAAALEQLDIPGAETYFAAATTVVHRSDTAARASTLAGALLGELRYEQGRLLEARALLDASAALRRDVGTVEFLSATYGAGARVAAALGDPERAEHLLTTGSRIAEKRALPRLAARLTDERIRLGLPVPGDIRTRLIELPPYRRQQTRIATLVAELEHGSAIRLLLADRTARATATAIGRAEILVREITPQRRPRALLEATLLYACCLWAAGRRDEAGNVAVPMLRQCADHGIPRFPDSIGPGMPELVRLSRTRIQAARQVLR